MLGEVGVRPEAALTLIKWADKRWDKFHKRADWAERLGQLFDAYKERYKPSTKLAAMRPVNLKTLKANTPEIEWAVEGLLAKYTYGLLTGPTGVGKTQVALQMGMMWAKGGEWNDWVFPKLRVLYGSHEMGPNELLVFTDKLQLTWEQGEDEVFDVIPVGETISVLTQEGRDFYLQYIDDYDVFMFDTVSSSTHLPMLDERSAPGLVGFFTELASRGKTVLALGHDTKDASSKGIHRAESMYGHRYLMDRSSLIIRIDQPDPEDREHLVFYFPKVRLAEAPKASVWIRDKNTLWVSKTNESPSRKVSQRQAKQALKEAGFTDNGDEVF